MPKPVLSAEARRDLKGIQEYIANEQESPQAALKVIEKILDRIENLLIIPDTGTLLSKVSEYPPCALFRCASVRTHIDDRDLSDHLHGLFFSEL